MSSEKLLSVAILPVSNSLWSGCGTVPAIKASQMKGKRYMKQTFEVITEIIRNPKHPFRKADDAPAKAKKHRYERRKIKEFIRLKDWTEEQMA